eukprot:g9214.t1
MKGAIKRRARRLARVRKKNKARQDALELTTVNDIAPVADSTYFPAGPGGRAPVAGGPAAPTITATAAEQTLVGRAGAEDGVGSAGISAAAASYNVSNRPASALAPTSKRRSKKHATIKGRPIVKGGKGRGLWRSIFGPRPLLEVHSIDQLSQLVDVEGWALEDLSVFTGGGGGRSSTESVAAHTTVAATATASATAIAAVDLDGVAQEAAPAAGANNWSETPLPESGGAGRDLDLQHLAQRTGPATATIDSVKEEEDIAAEEDGDDDVHLPAKTNALPAPQGQQQQQQPVHPAVQAVLDRAAAGTAPSLHRDGRRIGLAIEGGGMRGCVAAGMASCLHYLGLADSFDCVYGASAGSLIGAYFVSRQSNGTAVYHDILPSAGARFIDMAKFPQALGFELPKVSKKGTAVAAGKETGRGEDLSALKAARAANFARVIRLDFLLDDVVGRVHALDFEAFRANDKLQPLHVVASGVSSMSTVSLASRRGHFSTVDELTGCIRASMLVPGLAGPLLSVPERRRRRRRKGQPSESLAAADSASPPPSNTDSVVDSYVGGSTAASQAQRRKNRDLFWRRGGSEEDGRQPERDNGVAAVLEWEGLAPEGSAGDSDSTELLVDAMVFEPLPYRSAIEDGCTDVVVLCTRPKGSQVLGKKPSIYETRVVKKFFEQHDDPVTTYGISDYVQKLRHLRVYAEDALVLGEGSRTGVEQPAPKGGAGEGREAFLLAIAPDASCKEVGQLEMDRRAILHGCRDGFAACYDTFVGGAASLAAGGGEGAPSDDGAKMAGLVPRSGAQVAQEYFPDSLLSSPADLDATYFERGFYIADLQQQQEQQHFSPLGPNGDSGNTRIGSGRVTALGRKYTRRADRDGGRELESLLLVNGEDEGAAAAAAAAVMEGIGGAAPPGAAGKTLSTPDGARGLLRRLLSRGKLLRSLRASSSRAASTADSAPEALVVGEDPCETRTITATDSTL